MPFHHGQVKSKCTPLTNLAIQPDAPAVGFDNKFRDTESQSNTVHLATTIFPSIIFIKNVFCIRRFDTGPLIFDGEPDLFQSVINEKESSLLYLIPAPASFSML